MVWIRWHRTKKERAITDNEDAIASYQGAIGHVSGDKGNVKNNDIRGGATVGNNTMNGRSTSSFIQRAGEYMDPASLTSSIPPPASSALRSISNLASSTSNVAGIITGCIFFSSSLAVSTWLQKYLLQISTGTTPRIIPSTVGLLSVACASNLSLWGACQMKRCVVNCENTSQYGGDFTHKLRNNIQSLNIGEIFQPSDERNFLRFPSPLSRHYDDAVQLPITVHQAKVAVVGLTIFKLCGGRFWSIAPSSFTAPGSFARLQVGKGCVPAPSSNYITVKQRVLLRRIGQKHGCHTCGARTPFFRNMFVGDHIPPNAVVEQWRQQNTDQWYRRLLRFTRHDLKQKFFPQCRSCSNTQGGILATGVNQQIKSLKSLGGLRSASHVHSFRYRNSFFLPGGIISALFLPTPDDDEDEEYSTRFEQIQNFARKQAN